MTTMQAPRQVSGRPAAGQPTATKRTDQSAPRRATFWLVALVLTVTMLGTHSRFAGDR